MYYNRKRAIIKNTIFILAILILAVVATYNIYYHFSRATDIEYSSESLDITFHEQNGSKVTLVKAVPVSDSVGLSSAAYTFTVKNNLTEPVEYKVKLVDDADAIIKDLCTEQQIPKELLRVSIKVGNGKNSVYTLSDLEDGVLENDIIGALEEKNYSIRLWLNNSPTMSIGNDLHYHGIIEIVEDNDKLAIR